MIETEDFKLAESEEEAFWIKEKEEAEKGVARIPELIKKLEEEKKVQELVLEAIKNKLVEVTKK